MPTYSNPSNISPTYATITSNTTTLVKTGPGVLHRIVYNTKGASSNTAVLWDALTATGTKIGTIDTTAVSGAVDYGCSFGTGLTIVTATGTAADMTIVYN